MTTVGTRSVLFSLMPSSESNDNEYEAGYTCMIYCMNGAFHIDYSIMSVSPAVY